MNVEVITLRKKTYIYGVTLLEIIIIAFLLLLTLIEYAVLRKSIFIYVVFLYYVLMVRIDAVSRNLWDIVKRILTYYVLRKQEY